MITFKQFAFEAAHQTPPFSTLHGHSFKVEVFLKGEPDEGKQWLCDFAEVEQRITSLRRELDHNYLNDIEGLEIPTLENITRWIWHRLDNELPGLDRVLVRRGSCGEACVYTGRAA